MIRSRRPHYHRHLVAAVGIRPDADLKYALCVCLCLDSRYVRNVKKTKQNKTKHENYLNLPHHLRRSSPCLCRSSSLQVHLAADAHVTSAEKRDASLDSQPCLSPGDQIDRKWAADNLARRTALWVLDGLRVKRV